MTAIEDDLTRVLARSVDMARLVAELPLDETGHIKACGYDDGDGCECVSLRARLAAVLAPIVAAHVAAGQEQAWDEGHARGWRDGYDDNGNGHDGRPEGNPYRAATYTGTSSRPDAADVSQGRSGTADDHSRHDDDRTEGKS